jgi:hypothetical protein
LSWVWIVVILPCSSIPDEAREDLVPPKNLPQQLSSRKILSWLSKESVAKR